MWNLWSGSSEGPFMGPNTQHQAAVWDPDVMSLWSFWTPKPCPFSCGSYNSSRSRRGKGVFTSLFSSGCQCSPLLGCVCVCGCGQNFQTCRQAVLCQAALVRLRRGALLHVPHDQLRIPTRRHCIAAFPVHGQILSKLAMLHYGVASRRGAGGSFGLKTRI